MSPVAPAPAAASGRREATKQANRAEILAAAARVFAEVGYGAATVRDVVRETGLAPGTFYNYFADKEAVFRALLEESAGEARGRARAARRAAATPEAFVEDAYRAFFSFLVSDPGFFALVRRNAGTIRTVFGADAMGVSVAELEEDLSEGAAADALAGVDPGFLAAAMVGVAFEVGVALVERPDPDVEAATRFATGLFLGGIERLAT